MNTDALADLFAGLANGIPALPRAACRRHGALFDSTDSPAVGHAVEICRRCPELTPCRAWADSQPPRTLLGVVGGTLHAYSFRTTPPPPPPNK